jgi:hypothetical protein
MYKKINSEQKRPTPSRSSTAGKTRFRLSGLNPGLRTGYALVSFLLGITYLKILTVIKFEFSLVMLLFVSLGAACFAVCIFNLVSIWPKNR